MIEKITDQNLERYDSRLKEWCDRKFFEKGSYGKYQTTEEAGIVTFYPVPNTPLEGKVKFSFKEVMPINGDKSLDNPSSIFGTSSIYVRVTNKNLLPVEYTHTTIKNGYSWDYSAGVHVENNNGTYLLKLLDGFEKAAGLVNSYIMRVDSRDFYLHSGTYTLSGYTQIQGMDGGQLLQLQLNKLQADDTTPIYQTKVCKTGSTTFTIEEDMFANVYIRTPENSIFPSTGFTCTPQLELGSEATAFEPGELYESKINLGDTYYGGEIDLATGVMTVTHASTLLNGSTYFTPAVLEEYPLAYRLVFYPYPSRMKRQPVSNDVASNTIQAIVGVTPLSISSINFTNNSNGINVILTKTDTGLSDNASYSDVVAAFNSFFLAHPTTLVYPIDEPYTVQLSPIQISTLAQMDKYTPRLNTVYTDADSIQISYLKSPIRDEYEKTQAILSLGGNS